LTKDNGLVIQLGFIINSLDLEALLSVVYPSPCSATTRLPTAAAAKSDEREMTAGFYYFAR
jgi:hypothetical protein